MSKFLQANRAYTRGWTQIAERMALTNQPLTVRAFTSRRLRTVVVATLLGSFVIFAIFNGLGPARTHSLHSTGTNATSLRWVQESKEEVASAESKAVWHGTEESNARHEQGENGGPEPALSDRTC